ncbi:MAG TPA: TM2 domain-containing protein [Alkalispirochaeta sp.]|nr:TM2 domain-containing protein [Alkalispirochaeta sp.]
MASPQLSMAYLFWLPSLIGVAGLHRFYLGKPVSGIFFLMTGGIFGLGTLYDALTMPQQVRTARLSHRLGSILDEERLEDLQRAPPRDRGESSRKPRPVEQEILHLAAERHGVVSPSRVAIRAEVSPEKARDQLDRLVRQGFAEVQVTRQGLMVYVFPEFLDDHGRQELEELI